MRKYYAKIIVKMKPWIHDPKSESIKEAIINLIPLEGLKCVAGNVYYLDFLAKDQCDALHIVEKISMQLLSNDLIENYEIRKLEEV
jgi:phosphoribosylformylglycinamidine (FGAM) synthase PurS component